MAFVVVLLVMAGAVTIGQAQQQPAAKDATPAAGTASIPTVPSDEKIVILIFSTMIALNQANATGNYTVFREIASPAFQVANSQAKLVEIFAELRSRNFDLSPVLMMQPQLVRKPELGLNGMLRVSGFFPTVPERVNFDLIFQSIDDQWRLFGISAKTTPVETAPAAQVEPQPAPVAPTEAWPEPAALDAPAPAPAPQAKQANKKVQAEKPSEGQQLPDVKDRIEKLETAPPAQAKSKPAKSWNPFAGF